MNEQETQQVLDIVICMDSAFSGQLTVAPESITTTLVEQISGNPNTKAVITLDNGTTREYTYNRESFTAIVKSVLGANFTLPKTVVTEPQVIAFLGTKGLTLSEEEIEVRPVGTVGLNIRTTNRSLRYFGGINIPYNANADLPSENESSFIPELEMSWPARLTAANATSFPYLTPELIYTNTINEETKENIISFSGRVYATEALFKSSTIRVYMGTPAYTAYVKQTKISSPDTIVMRAEGGSNGMDIPAKMVEQILQHDPALDMYYMDFDIGSLTTSFYRFILSDDGFVARRSAFNIRIQMGDIVYNQKPPKIVPQILIDQSFELAEHLQRGATSYVASDWAGLATEDQFSLTHSTTEFLEDVYTINGHSPNTKKFLVPVWYPGLTRRLWEQLDENKLLFEYYQNSSTLIQKVHFVGTTLIDLDYPGGVLIGIELPATVARTSVRARGFTSYEFDTEYGNTTYIEYPRSDAV